MTAIHKITVTCMAFIAMACLASGQSARPLQTVSGVADLAARYGNGNETVMVLDGGTFADSTGNATVFIRHPGSSAATNQTDTLAAQPSGRWIVKRVSAEPTPFLHADDRIAAWFNSQSYTIASVQMTDAGVITNATIRWPDGSSGYYSVTQIDAAWNAPNAWEYSHAITGKTFTQAAVTRSAINGVVTYVPPIAVAPAGDVFAYPYTNYIGGIGYYGNLNTFRAATNAFTVVIIGSDTNGLAGIWARGLGSGTNDGANWWSDAAGTQIKRVQ